MFDFLEKTDRWLFLLINGWHSPFWDQVMWLASSKLFWIPLYLFILGWLAKTYKKRFWVLLLFIVLLVVVTDQASVQLFKKVFLRPRPCHNETLAPLVHLVHNHCGGMYGFVSSHASNMFGIATFTALLLRNRTYTLLIYLWAAGVGYSRIYLGVHYPGDVLGGALLGTLVGWLVFTLFRLADKQRLRKRAFSHPSGSAKTTTG